MRTPYSATESLEEDRAFRTCPFCSVQVRCESALCSACGRFSKTSTSITPAPFESVVGVLLGEKINRWKGKLPELKLPVFLPVSPPKGVERAIVGGCILLALLNAMVWLRYGGLGVARGIVEAAIVAAAILTRDRVLRDDHVRSPEIETDASESNGAALGYRMNLMVVQLACIAIMVTSIFTMSKAMAWAGALAGLVLAIPLFQARWRNVSVACAIVSVAYMLLFQDEIAWYAVEINLLTSGASLVLMLLEPYILVLAVIASLPHLQMLKVGRFGIGSLRGDRQIHAFGSNVSLAFTSSLLLVCSWGTLMSLWNAPGLIEAAVGG